jgi:hypothetical protein
MKKKKNKNLPIDNGLPKAAFGLEMLLPMLGNIGAGTGATTGAASGLAGAGGAGLSSLGAGAAGGLGTATGAGAGLQSLGSTAAGSVSSSTGGASSFANLSKGMQSMNPLGPLATATTKAVTDMIKAIIEPEENYRTTLKNAGAHYATGGYINNMDMDNYANGGKIYIKPSKKGTFTAAAKKRGKGVQEFASQVLANKDKYSPAMVKKANFARNASKWKKAMGGLVEPEIFEMGGFTGNYMDAFDYMALGGITGGPGDPPTKTKLPALNKSFDEATAAELIGGSIQNLNNYDPSDLERVKLGYYKSGQEYTKAFNDLENAYSKYNAFTDVDREKIKQENPQIFNPLHKSYNLAKFYQCDDCYGSSNITPSKYEEYIHPVSKRKINIARFENPKSDVTPVVDLRSDAKKYFASYENPDQMNIDKDLYTKFLRSGVLTGEEASNLEPYQILQRAKTYKPETKAMGGMIDPLMAFGGMIDPSMYMEQMMYGSYAGGGQIPQNIPVEVEGEEMYEMPNGQTGEFQGPKHENGGIPIALPEGTKIYSDRLKVNGKTMAARKEKREANIKKLEKLLTKNPSDRFIKEALQRQQETASLEEQQDMQMQEQANQQQAIQEQAMEEMLMGAAQQDIQEGMMAMGGMIKRADGSYSKRGLWDNIRANRGSGKKPTKEMLKQEKKIRAAEKAMGGLVKYDGGTPIAGIPQTNYANPYINPYAGLMQNPMLQSSMPTELDVNTFGYNSYSPSYADAVLNNNIGNTYGVTAGIENTIPRTNMPEPINIEETSLRSTYTPTFESSVPAFTQEDSQKRKKPGFDLSGIFGNFGGSNTSSSDVRYTEGDRMGMMGNLMGMFGPSAMTMLNRLETPKNKNFFREFGQEALRTQMEAEGIAGMAKDEANKKNKEKANALRKQLANSGRGVGDIKTGQLMAALAEQEGARDILTGYLQSMAGLKGQRAQLQQQIDQTRMGGEYQRDLADRQDIDQFYTNLAENLATASEFTQKTGRDMNTALRNKHILQASKYYSAYGIYADIDENGNFVLKDDSTGKTITEKEAKEKKKKMDEEAKKAASTTASTTPTEGKG